MKIKKIAHLIALIGVASPALAQTSAPEQPMQKVEITGSSIKRLLNDGAMPLQIISRDDIERSGITSAEQLVATLTGNGTGADNMTSNQGGDFLSGIKAHNNGAAGVSLRGLGSSNTLVLLNGRRVATHGLNGQSVDLNSIPLAAIARVEVLKDGASAIYGTDAIGGVINFILRRDYTGVEVSAFYDKTQMGGGDITRASILVGGGDLDKDRFNYMASVAFDSNTKLEGKDRAFHNGYQPARGLAPDTSGAPYANLRTASGTAVTSNFKVIGDPTGVAYSRFSLLSVQGKCNSIPGMIQYESVLWGNPALAKACAYDYGSQWVLQQPVDRANLVSRANFKIDDKNTAFVEVTASETKSNVQYTPIQIAFTLPNTSPYYMDFTPYIVGFDKTKGERLQWRCLECGSRQQQTKTDTYRVLAGLEGEIGGYDYKTAISTAGSTAKTNMVNGYVYNDALLAVLQGGVVNPFLLPGQTQSAAAMSAIQGTKATGPLYSGSTSLLQFDGTLSKNVMQLPAGPLAAAAGFDLRRETYHFDDDIYHQGQPTVNGVGSGPALKQVTRDIEAFFAELSVPVIKDMEMQLAVRHDHYNDFGSTTNPKVGVRWQPVKQLTFRASANRGFHAPDYDALNSGETLGLLNNFANDPACPTTAGITCRDKWNTVSGGNPNLKPEKSKQKSIGFVLAPTDAIAASLDYWKITRTDRIVALAATDVLDNYAALGSNVVRLANGQIDYIRAGYINAAGDEVKGVDVSLAGATRIGGDMFKASIDGTYLDSFKTHLIATLPWQELVGKYSQTDLALRWKHQIRLTWSHEAWSVLLTQDYKAGYKDWTVASLGGTPPPGFNPDVKSYTLYNVSATWAATKNLSVTGGIKNILNTDPPFSAHNVDEVAGAGWDARVGDPRGRAFTIRMNYKFM